MRPASRILPRVLPLSLLSLALLAGFAEPATAQSGPDTRGRHFWVAFPRNLGSLPTSELILYLSADTRTRASIIFRMLGDTITVDLEPGVSTEVSLGGWAGMLEADGDWVEGRAVEVIAEDEVALYGMSINDKSADGFLGLPTDLLGRRYIVLASQNGMLQPTPSAPRDFDMPSEFMIVATEDDTRVTITLPEGVELQGERSGTFTIALDRGATMMGQAVLKGPVDVTGTEITADRPVAVFAANARTSMPASLGNSRDYLLEQLPPVDVVGREVVITPHYPITPGATGRSVARIMSLADEVAWQINGVTQNSELMRGLPVEIELDSARVIKAGAPILVAQYERSVGIYADSLGMLPDLGDPFMMLVPGTDQFDTAYTTRSVGHEQFADTAHFLNVVIPSDAAGGFSVDHTKTLYHFRQIPGTIYSWAQIRVEPGSHQVTAGVPFGLYVYGFGPASSYGYPAGIRMAQPRSLVPAPAAEGATRTLGVVSSADGLRAMVLLPEDVAFPIRLTLHDPAGRELRSMARDAAGERIELDLTGVAPGTYLLRLIDADGVAWTGKVGVAK